MSTDTCFNLPRTHQCGISVYINKKKTQLKLRHRGSDTIFNWPQKSFLNWLANNLMKNNANK